MAVGVRLPALWAATAAAAAAAGKLDVYAPVGAPWTALTAVAAVAAAVDVCATAAWATAAPQLTARL